MQNYMIFLLLGVIFICSSMGLYALANFSTEYNIPKGAIWIELGPHDFATPNRTRIIVSISLPDDWLDLQVYFNFSEIRQYYISITMPYKTLQASPYVEYMSFRYTNETSQIGTIKAYSKTFKDKGSSVINATFTPNAEFTFLPNEPIALSISAKVSGLTSIKYPLASKQTAIMTFFGDETGVWDDEMAQYIGINSYPMIDYPFQVIIQFPKENYLSSDTFPNPIELFITERFRSAIFDLDFSYPKGHAQTISCSYSNATNEINRQFMTFLSGTLLTLGITLCLESYREKRRGKEMPEEKSTNRVKKSKEAQDETILRLIRLVDRNFRFKWYDQFFGDDMAYLVTTFGILVIFVEIYVWTTASLYEKIVIGLSLLAFTVAFLSLISHFTQERKVAMNFRRISRCIEDGQRPLILALLKMKAKCPHIKLEEVYNQNESMFQEERLLEKLYD